jgi:general secretion pathway protein G
VFTKAALIVAAAAVLMTGFAQYSKSVKNAHEAALKQDLLLMREALDQYHADRNTYPASLEALVDEKYLRGVPTDPFTNSTASWVEISGPTPGSLPSERGVFDVRSGAPEIALDGSPYSGW